MRQLICLAVLLTATSFAGAQFGSLTSSKSGAASQPGLFAFFGQNVTSPSAMTAMSGFRPATPAFNLSSTFPSMFSNLQNALSLRPAPATPTIYQFGMFPPPQQK